MTKHTKTLKVRIQDKHAPLLNSMARSVNFVWNFVNELSQRSIDALHKFSRTLIKRCGEIYVGNVSSLKLVKTTMAKSVPDADCGQLKTILDYKCAHAGIVFKEVNEAYTTQTCSSCGKLPESRPRGIAGLGIREWTYSACGVTHSDRDINAARNILAVRHGRLAVGISASLGR